MVELHLAQPQPVENWNSFMARLNPFSEKSKKKIYYAYQLATRAHRDQWRISGEPYFEHLRGVAVILLDDCQITDVDVICGALLHDTLEDTNIFGRDPKMTHSQRMDKSYARISRLFSPKTAKIVVDVTEPEIDNIEVLNKAQAKTIKYEKLRNTIPETLLVKMADRLHNLRTFYPKEDEKTPEERIRETEEILIPIFETALEAYPREAGILLGEIHEAIAQLRSRTGLSLLS